MAPGESFDAVRGGAGSDGDPHHGHQFPSHACRLGITWAFTDEWYDFRAGPRGAVRVPASADESSYEGGGMAGDHPLVRCHEYGGARVFYTALGHTAEAYDDPDYRAHLIGGLPHVARLP